MKKLLAAMLCLALLLPCAFSAAEAPAKTRMATLNVDNVFAIQGVLPDGYILLPQTADPGRYIASIVPSEAQSGRVAIVLSIAYDELLSDVKRMNDLDENALAQIEATFREEEDTEISYRETDYGTKVMVVRLLDETGATQAVDFYTIYLGFEVEIILFPYDADGGQLYAADGTVTEEQIAMAIDFLSDMDFVPAE